MKTEIEAKFLAINPEEIQEKLKKAGAECIQPMMLMRRTLFDTPDMVKDNAFLRIRDEGRRVTMTYKKYEEMSLTGAKEIECNVSDFDTAVQLCEALGLHKKTIQEAKREVWELGDVEVVIDEWPWIKPFIEIEGPTEESVKRAAKKLGLDWENAAFGDVMTSYRAEFPNTGTDDAIWKLPAVKFNDPVPSILKV